MVLNLRTDDQADGVAFPQWMAREGILLQDDAARNFFPGRFSTHIGDAQPCFAEKPRDYGEFPSLDIRHDPNLRSTSFTDQEIDGSLPNALGAGWRFLGKNTVGLGCATGGVSDLPQLET
jgi:hypothetical protein